MIADRTARSRSAWPQILLVALGVVVCAAACGVGGRTPSSVPGSPSLTPFVSVGSGAEPTATPTKAQVPGTFIMVGSIPDLAPYPTATELADGRVLITNTQDGFAYVFDPVADNLVRTGEMAFSRSLGTATLLDSGLVLLAGGDSDTAELFDPRTLSFTPAARMGTHRTNHTATRLLDGRVLFTGGMDDRGYLASAEIYDPATNTFAPTGSMLTARENQTATLLPDGRVLILGGDQGKEDALASAEVFDPSTGRFAAAGSMTTARTFHAAVLLKDGSVFVVGGSGDVDQPKWSEIFDPAARKSARGPELPYPAEGPIAVTLPTGAVLVAGGFDFSVSPPQALTSACLYDPAQRTFASTGSLTTGRAHAIGVALRDGRVLVVGGVDSLGYLNSLETYRP
jgi:hypothetical protein